MLFLEGQDFVKNAVCSKWSHAPNLTIIQTKCGLKVSLGDYHSMEKAQNNADRIKGVYSPSGQSVVRRSVAHWSRQFLRIIIHRNITLSLISRFKSQEVLKSTN